MGFHAISSAMDPVMNQHRVFGYDVIKALAMFMVVFYHLFMLDFAYVPGEFYVPNFNKVVQMLCTASVPMFFMVNGALTKGKKLTLKKLLNKVGRLIGVAFFWTIVLKCLVLNAMQGKGLHVTFWDFFNYYWFLYSLAIIYVLNYLVQFVPKWCTHLLVAALFAVTFLNNFMWDIILLVKPEQHFPKWGLTGFFTMYGFVYARLGAYLSNRRLSKTACVLLMVAGVALNVFKTIVMTQHTGHLYEGVSYSCPTIGAMLLSCGIFGLLRDVKRTMPCSSLIELVGTNSMGVYIFHLVFVFFIRVYCVKGLLHMENLPILVVFMLALLVTVTCAYISHLITHSRCKVLLKL